jgi:D-beta-D-heptose 7-phosphate kinase/D-beta-D-heptose 1-phosphate adenosyltransferase
MEELRTHINGKIYSSLHDLSQQRAQWRTDGRTVVFTNGCFDLLHLGHLSYLSQARALGDILVVGVNSDASVSKLKGPRRPILPQNERLIQLAMLTVVDCVILFEEDTPGQLIQSLKPDILVKGGDYKVEEVVGKEIVEQAGGNVIIIPFLDGYSTSHLVEKIKSL